MNFFQYIFLTIFVSLTTFSNTLANNNQNNSFNFLAVSDIHFNPYASCNKNITPCPVIEALRSAPVVQWNSILAKYDTQSIAYGSDSSYSLLKSSLAQLKKEAQISQPKFVMILGDFLGHGYRDYFNAFSSDTSLASYQAFVKKTYEYLADELQQTFPNTDVYPMLGNNDSYVDDYDSDLANTFHQDLANIWSKLISNATNQMAMSQDFSQNGYYTVDVNNVELIVLNTNYFSVHAKTDSATDQAAQAELNYLQQKLQLAKNANKKVMIAMHIPDTIDIYSTLKQNPFQVITAWKPQYSAAFQTTLNQFSDTIGGVFAGHFHTDWLQSLSVQSQSVAVIGVPAISPLFGNNPGYKRFEYSVANNGLTNYSTVFYALSTNSWNTEYDFNQIYQPGCTQCQVTAGINLLQVTGSLADSYKNYFALGTNSQPITKTNKWNPYYWCAIHNADINNYQTCVAAAVI